MNLFKKWLAVGFVVILAAALEMGDRREPSCSALNLGCPILTPAVKTEKAPLDLVEKL